MQFTDWAACYECNLANDISFEGGLRYLPPSVVFVLVSGHYRCVERDSAHWVGVVKGSITAALHERSADILVSVRRLRVGNL